MYMKSFVTYVVVYCQKSVPFSPASGVASLYMGGGGGGGEMTTMCTNYLPLSSLGGDCTTSVSSAKEV